MNLHDVATAAAGQCGCPCHAEPEKNECWCGLRRRPNIAPPFPIAHNDAVRHLGGCPFCAVRSGGCDRPTDNRLRRWFEEKERRNRDDRIRRGQIRSHADVRRAIQIGVLRPGQNPREVRERNEQ